MNHNKQGAGSGFWNHVLWRESSSCSTSGTRHVTLVKSPVVSANSDHTNEMSILMSKTQRIIPISYRASTSSND